MLLHGLQLGVLASLAWLAWEDQRHRSVPVVSLLLYGLGSVGILFIKSSLGWWLVQDRLLSVVFLAVQFSLVIGFFYWRNIRKRKTEEEQPKIWQSIGRGDLIFILISAFCWPSHWFLPAYIIGLILGLAWALIASNGRPSNTLSIPLLTAMGISFGLVLSYYWWG
ncbi:MAG: hypothetical protein AAFU67_07385 [Bacteroidota bacterium]